MNGDTYANSRTATGAELIAIASRVLRLVPDRRDPERYHEEKSEIVHELRRLARAMGGTA